jgi:threonine/homoserine/homoserine lactone efflux protein
MFFTLIYMFAGVIGGFCSSAPIGPINLWVADATLKNKDSELPVFLAGVIFCDMTYAGLASWGYYKWLEDGPLYSVFSISGGAFLIVLGILGFLQKNRNSQVKSNTEDEKTNNKKTLGQFMLGFVMTGSNPAFLMFWVVAIDFLNQHNPGTPDQVQFVAFLVGIALGDGIWFKSIIALVKHGRDKINQRFLIGFRRIISLGFLCLGVAAILRNL